VQVVKIDFSDLDIGDTRLGKGGYGDVYEGNWKKIGGGKRVAVKVIRSSATQMVLREIRTWSSLPSHPNIITLYGVVYQKFNTFIVSELATNGSLFDYLHIEKNSPSVDQSLAWASHVAHGMKHLHDHDMIHRDLKSANVLLASGWVAKLCDFGCARELTHTVGCVLCAVCTPAHCYHNTCAITHTEFVHVSLHFSMDYTCSEVCVHTCAITYTEFVHTLFYRIHIK